MKPSDFFLGVSDLFVILLPGAILTFVCLQLAIRLNVPPNHDLGQLIHLENSAAWLAFGVVSYTLGHFIASLGAKLDPIYDVRRKPHRNLALTDHVDRLLAGYVARAENITRKLEALSGERPPSRPSGFALLAQLLTSGAWNPAKAARPSTDETERTTSDPAPAAAPSPPFINAYKLACIMLNQRAPGVFAEVARLEADSKFFRSFVVVAMLTLVAGLVQLGIDSIALQSLSWSDLKPSVWGTAYLAGVLLLLRLAYTRFCELRLKATETAFQGLIALFAVDDSTMPALGAGSQEQVDRQANVA